MSDCCIISFSEEENSLRASALPSWHFMLFTELLVVPVFPSINQKRYLLLPALSVDKTWYLGKALFESLHSHSSGRVLVSLAKILKQT